MSDISPEAIERMVALVRERIFAYREWDADSFPNYITEARAIVALLPEPVDPDLPIAREIADDKRLARDSYPFGQGQSDTHPLVQSALAGIRRGRELALKARDGES